MQTATALKIELALPAQALQILRGAELRQAKITNEYSQNNAVSADNWLGEIYVSARRMELDIEGYISNDGGINALRNAALQASNLHGKITWPDLAVSEGEFVVSEYAEYATGLDGLRFQAKLRSSDGQNIVI
jgi:hypothetical protein